MSPLFLPSRPAEPPAAVSFVTVAASPRHSFHHSYLWLPPAKLQPGAPIVVAIPTPTTTEDPAVCLAAAQRIARNAGSVVAPLNLPLLVPILPRPPLPVGDGKFVNLYFPALSRAALLATNPVLKRIDLQVLAMIDHARARVLADADLPLHPRAAFIGFSAGGHFATRMAILHPRQVLAVWAGGAGGHPILPLAQAQGFTLSYPVGVADLQEITGAPFDAASFKHVPIRLVQGALDTNSSLPTGSAPSDSYSAEQSTIAFKLLGDSPVERLGRAREFYRQVTELCETEVFSGAGHQMTPELVRDLANFIAGLAAP